jgi:protein phosphatase-4 regulatory subunit 3
MGDGQDSDQGWRARLYQLDAQGQWADRGTGHVKVAFLASLGGPALHVVCETTGKDLLQSRILEARDAYFKQGDIISWEERIAANDSIDLALSFQENAGCVHVWQQIQQVLVFRFLRGLR